MFAIMGYSMVCTATIRYVKPGSPGTAPYTSWATASNDLQAVINQCVAGDDIWVAAGTYIPNRRADATGTITVNDRDNAFVLKNGVRIFGGFNGTETATSQRNFATNLCILSGDLGIAGSYTDNCYHVLVGAGAVSGTALNGFNIRYGHANGSGTITVNAVSLGRGSGAGMRIGSSSPVISNCVFSANVTTNNGGGMVCDNASPAITNCLFSGNTANDGGAILNTNSSAPEIINCTFAGNNAAATAGAIRNGNASSPLISNCIIWGNLAAGSASAIYNADAGSVPDVNYSLVQGGYSGTAIVNADPLFVNPVAATLSPAISGDYRVQKCSPALNRGLNSYVPGSINNDLDYTPRINYATVDLGAYEKQLQFAIPSPSGIVYVDITKNGDGSSWGNAVAELADALVAAKYDIAITQIWVAKGTYYPKYTASLNELSCNTNNRSNSFVLVNNVKLFGGFAGAETDTAGRDFVSNETILNGDIGVLNQKNDNCTHVIVASGSVGQAELNGFTVKNGTGLNSNSAQNINGNLVPAYSGAGVICVSSSPVISNCIISDNEAMYSPEGKGGGVYIDINSRPLISDCIFQDNAARTAGSISIRSNLNPTITHCNFINNSAGIYGGGIITEGNSSVSIRDCFFSGNYALRGAGIYMDEMGAVSIDKCTFTNNSCVEGGGGIYIYRCNPVIDSCDFYSNSSTVSGGAILFNMSNPVISNSTFDSNSVNEKGGAVFGTDHSNANFYKCNFYYNTANLGGGFLVDDICNVNLDSCSFRYNTAVSTLSGAGGAIFNSSSFVTISNTEFESNRAAQNGGAILNIGSFSSTATDCKFLGNKVDFRGGAISQQGPANGSLFERCLFDSNRCIGGSGQGGALYSISRGIEFKDCLFRGNEAGRESVMRLVDSDSEFTNCLFAGNKSNSNTAVIYFNASDGLFSNCTFSGNKMALGTVNSVFDGESPSALTVNNSVIWGNEGTVPGASPINSVALTTTINYSLIEGGFSGTGNISANPLFIYPVAAALAPTISGNYRIKSCSPAVNAGSNMLIPSGITTDLDLLNRIKFTTVDMGAYEKHLPVPDNNGIVYVDASNIANAGNGSTWATAATELADALKAAITDTDIEQIWVARGTYKPLFLSTDNGTSLSCTVSNRDNAFTLRPGVELYGGFAGGEADTSGRDFTTNETILSGDIGVASNNADNTYHVLISSGAVGEGGINGFTVTDGHADVNTSYILNGNIVYRNYGGGMYLHSSSPFISQCNFTSNYALGNGGALAAINSNSNYSGSIFSGNSADKKGGAVSLQNCSSLISNTAFSLNTVNGAGPNNLAGGLYAENSSLHIFGSSFTSNAVLNGDGGAVVNELSAGSVFNSCVFSGNTAAGRAGGYYNLSSVSAIHNCVVTGNTAGTGGGAGVYNALAASLSVTSSTISGNSTTGNGGGLLTASPCTVTNSIVYNNTASLTGDNIYDVITAPTVSNSIIQDGFAGAGNYDTDPLFVSPQSPASAPTTAGDYHLQACSPAINLGDNSFIPSGLTKDHDSLDRIKYATVDMGAYEMQSIDLVNSTWKGVNANWNDKINWCGGYIPADTTHVTVPVTPNNPTISPGFSNEVKNISLAGNTSISVAGNSSFTINGTYTNNGSTIINNGTWVMAGNASSQTFPGVQAVVSAMHNLEINNSNGITLDKSFELTGTLTPTSGNIHLDNATVTLHSDATATASVAPVPSGVALTYAGTGRFEVERYIPPHRAWRLLTAPLSTATNLTISQAWQEGVSNASRLSPVDPSPGFGTTITKSTLYNASDGYDHGSTNNPSIRYYNGTNWGGVPLQTNGTTPGANNGLINDQPGYMLFVRGDRSIQVAGVGVTATATTLRPKGQLKTGPQTIVCNGWTVIGNPYASPINFHQIALDNPGLPDEFYVWEASLAGSSNVGGWISYGAYDGPSKTYTVTPLLPGSSAATNTGDIPSGSAFMVNYTGNIVIREHHKSPLDNNPLYRPARRLDISLWIKNADSSLSLNDGVSVLMDRNNNSTGVVKNRNFLENLSIFHQGKQYAILNRSIDRNRDTIWLNMEGLRQRLYQLWVDFPGVSIPSGMNLFLEDCYLHTYTPVLPGQGLHYAFTVTADPGSAAPARFRLLSRRRPAFLLMQLQQQHQRVMVSWKLDQREDVSGYTVERSSDGKTYIPVGRVPVYKEVWEDLAPVPGACYRVRADVTYPADIVSTHSCVREQPSLPGVQLGGNPVTGNIAQLRFFQLPAGNYRVGIMDIQGKILQAGMIRHSGGDASHQFDLMESSGSGEYTLSVSSPAGFLQILKMVKLD